MFFYNAQNKQEYVSATRTSYRHPIHCPSFRSGFITNVHGIGRSPFMRHAASVFAIGTKAVSPAGVAYSARSHFDQHIGKVGGTDPCLCSMRSINS